MDHLIKWDLEGVDWYLLAELYRRAPLGEREPEQLRDKFMLLTTTVGKEGFYHRLGFRKHKTAMAIYPTGSQNKAEIYLELGDGLSKLFV